MKSIKQKGLLDTIKTLEQPVLGVCLGMQLMVSESEENDLGVNELTKCLNLMPGKVKKMQTPEKLRLPHMGWNQVHPKADNPLFSGVDDGSYFILYTALQYLNMKKQLLQPSTAICFLQLYRIKTSSVCNFILNAAAMLVQRYFKTSCHFKEGVKR